MLYVSTRNKYNADTPPWTLRSDTAADGGRYLPFMLPTLSQEEVGALKEKTYGQTVAEMLNLFFGTGLTGWDVEFSVGRNPVKLASIGQKITVAECWRNLEGSYAALEADLAARICGTDARSVTVTSWVRIAIRIAMITAIFGDLQRQGQEGTIDVAVAVGDMTQVMALWYAKQMGLPIGKIICGCQDNDGVWDLLHVGQMKTAIKPTAELERLIHSAFGVDETLRYCGVCSRGETYSLLPVMSDSLRRVLFAAVVSGNRVSDAIPNVYNTSAYILEPEAAVGYSSLLDYRAKTGERAPALLLSNCNPADVADAVATAMKITPQKLKELL